MKPQIHQHRSLRELAYRLADLSGILLGMLFAVRLRVGPIDEMYLIGGCAAIIVFYLLGEVSGMYRNWRGVSIEREVLCAVVTWSATVPALLAMSVMTRHAQWVDRTFVLTWASATACLLAAIRIGARLLQCYLRSRGYNTRGYAVVGINDLGFDLAKRVDTNPQLGLKLVGFFDDRASSRLPAVPSEFGSTPTGTIHQLVQKARRGEVNMIYITFPMRAEKRIKNVLEKLGDSTASVYIVPDFFVFELLHSRWTDISGLPAVSVFENPFYGIDGFAKRLVDLTLATIALAACALPMAVIALLVKFSSPGPIFFRQKRYGLDGREILVWKFRSMRVCESGESCTQATKDDPRTTRLGAILRKTSIDELPQLFNVLEGTMSLVGPRPHATVQNEQFRPLIQGYMLRHKVKPGITGLAQVNGWRGETDTLEKMKRRVQCDHQYIREWSLWMDLKILVRTIAVVVSGKNAY